MWHDFSLYCNLVIPLFQYFANMSSFNLGKAEEPMESSASLSLIPNIHCPPFSHFPVCKYRDIQGMAIFAKTQKEFEREKRTKQKNEYRLKFTIHACGYLNSCSDTPENIAFPQQVYIYKEHHRSPHNNPLEYKHK